MIYLLIIMAIAVLLFVWVLKPLFSAPSDESLPEEVGHEELSAFTERELETDRKLDRIGTEDSTATDTQENADNKRPTP